MNLCSSISLIPLAFALILIQLNAAARVVDFSAPPYSGVGDGQTDNRDQLGKALASLSEEDILWIPAGDYRLSLTQAQLKIPSGATLQGEGEETRFLLHTSGQENQHREFLRFGSGAAMRGVSVIRNASFPIVMFPIFGDLKDIRLIDCHINGGKSKFPKGYCHAIQVGVGTVSGLQLKGLRVTDCNFGLFQANNATGTLKAVRVEQCVFEKNLASDLEFNSPKGKMSDVLVRNCVFRDNLSKSAGAGFAVGFANVKDATVEHCIIENYGSEALHVEDHSSGIRLSRNLIRGGSLKQNNGVIMVLSSSSKVSIDSNVIDARPNENRPHLILVTAGGQQFKNPSEVEVTNNILVHGPSTRTWYLQPGSGPKPTGNIISAFKDGTE